MLPLLFGTLDLQIYIQHINENFIKLSTLVKPSQELKKKIYSNENMGVTHELQANKETISRCMEDSV